MELTQAIQVLTDKRAAQQAALAVTDLALSVLQDEFAPQLQTLENARQELADEKTAHAADNEAKDAAIAERDASLADKDAAIRRMTDAMIAAGLDPSQEAAPGAA